MIHIVPTWASQNNLVVCTTRERGLAYPGEHTGAEHFQLFTCKMDGIWRNSSPLAHSVVSYLLSPAVPRPLLPDGNPRQDSIVSALTEDACSMTAITPLLQPLTFRVWGACKPVLPAVHASTHYIRNRVPKGLRPCRGVTELRTSQKIYSAHI